MRKIILILLLTIFVVSSVQASSQNDYGRIFSRNIYYGMKRNTDVVNLQKFLKDQGYFSGPANGNFGPSTLAAVKKFQLSNKIKTSGYWGPLTRTVAKNVKTALVQQNILNITVPTVPSAATTLPATTTSVAPPSIAVSPATTTPLSITTTSIPSATAGVAYSVTLSATGGTGSYSWQISSGSFPTGLSLVPTLCTGSSCPANATIFGTPISAWTYNFTVSVTSGGQLASQQFTLSIAPSVASLKISQSGPSTFNIGQSFETQAFYTPAPNCYPTNPCALPDKTAVPVQWASSNTAIATVAYKSYDTTTGVITAVSPGATTITANYITGNINLSASIPVFVSGTIGSSLQIIPVNPSVKAGGTIFLQALYIPQSTCSAGACTSAGSSVIQAVWASSNNTATVVYKSDDPKTAIVTGVSAGVTTITANVGYTSITGAALTASTGLVVTP